MGILWPLISLKRLKYVKLSSSLVENNYYSSHYILHVVSTKINTFLYLQSQIVYRKHLKNTCIKNRI